MPTILNVRGIVVFQTIQAMALSEHYKAMTNLNVEKTAFSIRIAVVFKEPRLVLLGIRLGRQKMCVLMRVYGRPTITNATPNRT